MNILKFKDFILENKNTSDSLWKKTLSWIKGSESSKSVEKPSIETENSEEDNRDISSLTDEHFYMYLEEGKIYLQHYHNPNMDDFFKDIKWFWNKDTTFVKRGDGKFIDTKVVKREAANRQYKNVKEWISYCGGRNSGLWIPTWNNI